MGSVDHSSMVNNNNRKDEDNDNGNNNNNNNNNRLITISNITFVLHHTHYSLAVLSQTTYYCICNCTLQQNSCCIEITNRTQQSNIKSSMLGEATAQSRCQTLCSSKVN